MTEFSATAQPANEGRLSPPPTGQGRLAESPIHENTMSASELKIMKERDASFLKAIDKHHRLIGKICHAWSRNRADQEDLYQEIVYQLWKAYPSFKSDSSVSTWMYSVAVRAAMLPVRRSKVPIEFHDVLPDRPSDEIVDDGIDDRVFIIFGRLENIDRAILLLMSAGFPRKEIGAIVSLTEKAVGMRMSRIRKVFED